LKPTASLVSYVALALKRKSVSISAFLAAKYVSGLAGLNALIVHRAPPNLGLPESMHCRVVAAEAGQVDR
jgi:hypothetical protein